MQNKATFGTPESVLISEFPDYREVLLYYQYSKNYCRVLVGKCNGLHMILNNCSI